VLRGVDLVAQEGQLHGLLGPNGAGKTTLMRVPLGLVQRAGGTVRLLGRDFTRPPVPYRTESLASLRHRPSIHIFPDGRISQCSLVSMVTESSDVQRPSIKPWRR
jgi:ABC-type multidrug transport system ATPase subunit